VHLPHEGLSPFFFALFSSLKLTFSISICIQNHPHQCNYALCNRCLKLPPDSTADFISPFALADLFGCLFLPPRPVQTSPARSQNEPADASILRFTTILNLSRRYALRLINAPAATYATENSPRINCLFRCAKPVQMERFSSPELPLYLRSQASRHCANIIICTLNSLALNVPVNSQVVSFPPSKSHGLLNPRPLQNPTSRVRQGTLQKLISSLYHHSA
jgi:hypothetical protein